MASLCINAYALSSTVSSLQWVTQLLQSRILEGLVVRAGSQGLPVLLMLMYSVKRLIAQEECLAASPRWCRGYTYTNRYCFPQTDNGVLSWSLSSSPSWSVGLSIQDKAMDVTRSAPQGSHYHADFAADATFQIHIDIHISTHTFVSSQTLEADQGVLLVDQDEG